MLPVQDDAGYTGAHPTLPAIPERGAIHRGQFEINGIRFPIPPQGVAISEQNQNFNFETLRTRESTKIRSGHAKMSISVTALFTGNTTKSVESYKGVDAPSDPLSSINETLMPILYSLKKMPLCFIDNELLRATLPLVPGEVIGAFLQSVNVSTTPGMPTTLTVEFQFVWFNHRPFTPRLKFRKEWSDAERITDYFASCYGQMASTGGMNTDDDSGRAGFIKNYGHPGVVFNATAIHSETENILEARPLLEWLWPHRYPTTNPVIKRQQITNEDGQESFISKTLRLFPPFGLKDFDQDVTFEFAIPQNPEDVQMPDGTKVSITDVIDKFTKPQKLIPETDSSESEIQSAGPTAPAGTDVISLYRNPRTGRVLTTSERAVANLIYTRLTDEGYTPAFAVAAIVQSSFESGLDPTAIQKVNGRATGPGKGSFQLDTAVGLGMPDPSFMGGRTAGSADQARLEPDKYYDATDLGINISRIISVIRTRSDIKKIAKDKTKTPAECFERFFWSTLGAGERNSSSWSQTPKKMAKKERFEIGFRERMAYGQSRIPGWNNPGFNSGERLPGRISASDLSIAMAGTPLEQRFSEIHNSEEALRIAIENFVPDQHMATQSQLIKLARTIAEQQKGAVGAELIALADAVAENTLIVKHAITNKISQIKHRSLTISDYVKSIFPTAVSVGFGTNLVMIPLQGHRFPTIQYTGGQQTAATISFRADTIAGRAFVRDFQDLQNSFENSAIWYREFSRRRGIGITNSLINGMGISNVIIESINFDTVPGAPEGLNIVLRLMDNAVAEDQPPPILPIEDVSQQESGVKVLQLMLDKGWIQFKLPRISTVDDWGSHFDPDEDYRPKTIILSYEMDVLDATPEVARKTARKLADIVSDLDVPFGNDWEDPMQRLFERITSDQYAAELGRPIGIKGTFPRSTFVLLCGTKKDVGFIGSSRFYGWSANSAKGLIGLLGRPGTNDFDKDFGEEYSKQTSGKKQDKNNQAFNDLLLPPNPISGLSIDTNPDFFMVNPSDTKCCNSEALKIILGPETYSNSAKARGLSDGILAIQNGHQGVLDVYGKGGPGAMIRPANEGKDGVYVTGANNNIFKTSDAKDTPISRTEPPSDMIMGELPGRDFVVENDISARVRNGKYSRDKIINNSYSNSPYAAQLKNDFINGSPTGEKLESTLKIQHNFKTTEYETILKKVTERYSSDHFSVRRAFPTFKVYLVEEDGELDMTAPEGVVQTVITKAASSPALDDFYGVNAIKEISIVHAKDMAASTCMIQVLDLDGVFYNKKFDAGPLEGPLKDTSGTINSSGGVVYENKLEDRANPFYSTMIKEGMKVVVKFGYVNDPNELDTLFVGQIVQFEGDQILTIVCQSYGSELVAKQFGNDPSENADFWNVQGADLVHDTLDREELRHFGRWKLSDISAFGPLFGQEKFRPDGKVKKVYSWRPSVVDDNVFLPEKESSFWDEFFGDMEYVYYDTTIWEVFKEMELRYPGCIAYPVPYGTGADARMTMFFGHPDMPYLSRPAVDQTERENEFGVDAVNQLHLHNALVRIGEAAHEASQGGGGLYGQRVLQSAPNTLSVFNNPNEGDLNTETARALGAGVLSEAASSGDVEKNLEALAAVAYTDTESLKRWLPAAKTSWNHVQKLASEPVASTQPGANVISRIDSDKLTAATMAWQGDRIRPFRNYEMVTSLHDIIRNEIRADHRDTYNSIELQYSNGKVNFGTFGKDAPEVLTVNADDNIKEHHIRRNIESWPNCTTTNLAKRYASQLLANSLKRTYKGTLTIMGRPKLKPYDVVWLYDNYSDMSGPLEIEEVVHTFSQETGLISEIVPNMIVSVSDEAKMLMTDAIGAFFTQQIGDFTNGFLAGLGGVGLIRGGQIVAKAGVSLTNIGSKAAEAASKVISKSATATKVANATVAASADGAAAAGAGIKAAAGATVATGSAAALVAGTVGAAEDGINTDTLYGFSAGVGVTLLAEFMPITVAVSGIVAGHMLYKFLKYNSTREPIIITPLIKDGKPYVTGLEGFESDGLLCTDFRGAWNNSVKRWRYYGDGWEDAMNIVKTGWHNFWDN